MDENNFWEKLRGFSEHRLDRAMVSMKYDEAFETKRWNVELPYLKFPSHWQVKIVPPNTMAVIRFRVKTDKSKDSISIYFDGYNLLGYMNGPYWEIYPIDDDTERFYLGEEQEMLRRIEVALQQMEKENDKSECEDLLGQDPGTSGRSNE